MVPTTAFPPAMPFTLQVTAAFDVPVTVAVSCCVLPSNTLELGDETITVTAGGGEVIVRTTLPLTKLSAWLVAWIVTVAGLGKSGGAVEGAGLDVVATTACPPGMPFRRGGTAAGDARVTGAVRG